MYGLAGKWTGWLVVLGLGLRVLFASDHSLATWILTSVLIGAPSIVAINEVRKML